jgi:hypothetical protein
LEKQRLTKDEYLDQLDPDKLNLEKKDLLNFCHKCTEEWKKSKLQNFKYIVAIELIAAGVKCTPEDVLKAVWKKILVWFYDLQFKNALAEKEGMLKRLAGIGSG